MINARSLTLVLLLAACGRNDPTVLIRDVATEVKDKPRVQLIVKIATEQPTADDLKLRTSLEDRIDNERIGRLISSGGGSGQMEITLEVDNTADGIAKLRAIALDAGVLKQASFKVLPALHGLFRRVDDVRVRISEVDAFPL